MKKNYIGKRYGKLVVIQRNDIGRRKNGVLITKFIAQCDCGNIHEVDIRNITKTDSCGCSKRRKSNQVYINRVYSFYKKNAKRKGHDFELEFDELIDMTQQNCNYCGCEPANDYKLADDGFEFKYNGIDRMDNSKGYVAGNVVPCCKTCNAMKSNLSTEEFISQVEKIIQHHKV